MKKILCICLSVLLLCSLTSCGKNEEPTETATETETENTAYIDETIPVTAMITETEPPTETIPQTTVTVTETTTEAPTVTTTVIETTTQAATTLPVTEANSYDLGWSKNQIAAYLTQCVNATKALQSTVTVKHSESFTSNITDITGGDMVKNVANRIIAKIITPTEETLVFNNGTTVNSENETVQLLLPKNGAFSITENDIAEGKATKNGDNIEIELTLVPEQVGLGEVPPINSKAIGYLDTSIFDISLFTISKLEINYTGSVIKAVINPDGYVISADYTIKMHTDAAAKAMGISGTATFDGFENEVWEIVSIG